MQGLASMVWSGLRTAVDGFQRHILYVLAESVSLSPVPGSTVSEGLRSESRLSLFVSFFGGEEMLGREVVSSGYKIILACLATITEVHSLT